MATLIRDRAGLVSPAAALAALAVLLLAAGDARAVVNPALQPSHLMERYNAVLGLKVKAIADDNSSITLEVSEVVKGALKAPQVTLRVDASAAVAADAAASQPQPRDDFEPGGEATSRTPAQVVDSLAIGQVVVAFVGKPRRAAEGDVLFYIGGGQWQQGRLADPAEPGVWQWTAALGPEMYGTFTGATDRLLDMVRDAAAGEAYFPALPYVQFKDDIVLARLDKPVGGVALYDVDGDGRLDVYACSAAGDRLLLQRRAGEFTDATAEMGLESLCSVSCCFGDVNADGRTDLLADGTLYLGGDDSKKGFAASRLLPADAGKELLASALADVNGDGWPDVVVSRTGGGLSLYLNGGAAGGAFVDATAAAGLAARTAGRTGYFAVGDYNADGRLDLMYFAGGGMLLVQDARGAFQPVKLPAAYELAPAAGDDIKAVAAGVLGAVWRADRLAIVFPQKSDIRMLADIDGALTDVTDLGNEISEASYKQLLTIAEDFNADGYVDFYTTSWSARTPNTLHLNRGYGSYMRPEKYKSDVFPGAAHRHGALGAAAGDVDGDGTADLLLGGADGTLSLLLNDTLSLRRAAATAEHPTPEQKRQLGMSIISVAVNGPLGVTGAQVTLSDARGAVLDRRDIGGNIVTGCCGPAAVNLVATREGPCTLSVRYSDGVVAKQPIEAKAGKRVAVSIKRPAATTSASASPASAPASRPSE